MLSYKEGLIMNYELWIMRGEWAIVGVVLGVGLGFL